MKCERCLSWSGEVAEYRVCTEIIDVKVCDTCADEARAIGLAVTRLSKLAGQQRDDRKVAA